MVILCKYFFFIFPKQTWVQIDLDFISIFKLYFDTFLHKPNLVQALTRPEIHLFVRLLQKNCYTSSLVFSTEKAGVSEVEYNQLGSRKYPYALGRSDMGGKIKKVWFTYSDTLFSLYFLILRQVRFLAFFYLRTPSFANLPIYIY